MIRCRTNEKREYREFQEKTPWIEPIRGSFLHELLRRIGPWTSKWKEPEGRMVLRKAVEQKIRLIERPCWACLSD